MRTQSKTVLVLVGTLVLGMVIGWFGHGVYSRDQFRRKAMHMRTPEGFMRRFIKELDPTPEQQKKIEDILKKHYEEMGAYWESFKPKMDAMRDELNSVLTDEQKKKLEERIFKKRRGGPWEKKNHDRSDRRKWRKNHRDSLPPPPPPG